MISLVNSFFKKCVDGVLYCIALLCGSWAVLRFYVRQRVLRKHIPNFQEVDEKVLLRGGQPSSSGLSKLMQTGIKTVINLRQCKTFPGKKTKDLFQGKVLTFHLPFSPYRPSDRIAVIFLKILLNPKYHPAYVHCFHGADRTGTLCAIYRIVCQGWDKERAIEEMRSRGLHWWHNNLVDYIQKLDVQFIRSQLEEVKGDLDLLRN